MTPGTALAWPVTVMMVVLAVSMGPAARGQGSTPPVPVKQVDLRRYAGLWYEIARIPNRFQKQCVRDVTARYEIALDGRITVTNSCVEADGKTSQASGVAKIVDGETNSRLRVSFVSFLGVRPFWGDYWILGLGDDYEYAVIGGPDRKYGWILARSPHPTAETMEKAWGVVVAQGYDRAKFQVSSPDSNLSRTHPRVDTDNRGF
jgi:apolipoprotein D and lipocalin family protein